MKPPCFIDNMPESVYHDDPCPGPSLSSSIATKIVQDSPLHGWLAHPKFGNYQKPPTADMEYGTLMHALLLGRPVNVTEVPERDFRKKIAQEMRDAARATGSIPMLSHEWRELQETVQEVRAELILSGIRFDGKSERTALWFEETASGPIRCRGRMDHTDLERLDPMIYDIKTCTSAHPNDIRNSVVKFGADLQRAAYISAVEKIHPELAGRVEYRWIHIEIMPLDCPKRVIITISEADGSMRELGERKWQKACRIWAECMRINHWPAYSTGVVRLESRPWELEQAI